MNPTKIMMIDLIKSVIHGKPHVHIGKNGITNEVIQQINTLAEKKKVIKIKFLTFDQFDTIDDAAKYLQSCTNSKVVDVRGKSVVVLYHLS